MVVEWWWKHKIRISKWRYSVDGGESSEDGAEDDDENEEWGCKIP